MEFRRSVKLPSFGKYFQLFNSRAQFWRKAIVHFGTLKKVGQNFAFWLFLLEFWTVQYGSCSCKSFCHLAWKKGPKMSWTNQSMNVRFYGPAVFIVRIWFVIKDSIFDLRLMSSQSSSQMKCLIKTFRYFNPQWKQLQVSVLHTS